MYEDILVHTGRTIVTVAAAEKTSSGRAVQSETEPDADTPTWECCLFLPRPSAEEDRGQRKVKRPELLLDPAVEVEAEDRVEVLAPELTGPGFVRWEVEGDPQPFGPPGEELVGKLALVRRVKT